MGSGGLIRALMAANTGEREGELERAQREATLAQYAEQRALEQAQRAKLERETASLPRTPEEALQLKTAPVTIRTQGQEYNADKRLQGVQETNLSKEQMNQLNDSVRQLIAEKGFATKEDVAKIMADALKGRTAATNDRFGQTEGDKFSQQNKDLLEFGRAYQDLQTKLQEAHGNPAATKGAYLGFMSAQLPSGTRMSRYLEQTAGAAGNPSWLGRIANWADRGRTGLAPDYQLNDMQRYMTTLAKTKGMEYKNAVQDAVRKGTPITAIPTIESTFGSDPTAIANGSSLVPPAAPPKAVQGLFNGAPSSGLTSPRPGGPPKQGDYSADNPLINGAIP